MIREKNKTLKICDTTVLPGERITLAFPTPELYTCIPMYIPIHVIHGKYAGPCVLISAAMHGDEINGISIIQKLLSHSALKSIYGTIIAIPVVNVFGLLNHSRNLPDHRDLVASFPGSETGSLAARLTHALNKEILCHPSHIIHIESGEPHYAKLPQVQTNVFQDDLLEFAQAFNPPVIRHFAGKDGLAKLLKMSGQKVLIYTAGEALRQDSHSIRYGLNGIIRTLKSLNVLKSKSAPKQVVKSLVLHQSIWVRSPGSGLSTFYKKLGQSVSKGERLGEVTDPFGTKKTFEVISPIDGVIISCNTNPLLNEGDHLFEIGYSSKSSFSELEETGLDYAENWKDTTSEGSENHE